MVVKVLEYHCFLLLDPPEIVPFSFGVKAVNKGDFAQLICVVMRGDEPVNLSWSLKGDIISSDLGLSTTMLGTRTSMLTISEVNYRHTGTYTCRATNPAGSITHSASLTVNGNCKQKWKALEILYFRAPGDCPLLLCI